ncbi:hypothetical protein Taro_029826 [Colocasia esculenta]|uniref:Uncharacterized protein n=1 Tax=Colocasia esculenta TaxID=4460 RepID=A0A843VYB8_COLES|nr:hypothetical protein [Colocasia esculenta]
MSSFYSRELYTITVFPRPSSTRGTTYPFSTHFLLTWTTSSSGILSTGPETPCQGLRKSSWLWRTSIADKLVVPLNPDQYDPNGLSEISLILRSRRTTWLVYTARLVGGGDFFYQIAGIRPGVVQLLLSWFNIVLRLYPYLMYYLVLSSVHVHSTISSIHLVLS